MIQLSAEDDRSSQPPTGRSGELGSSNSRVGYWRKLLLLGDRHGGNPALFGFLGDVQRRANPWVVVILIEMSQIPIAP